MSDDLSEQDTVEQIVNNLQETNKEFIHRIVQVIGVKQALMVYNETMRIEGDGGLQREDGKGLKTPGGVFFYVLHHRHDIFNEELKRVFAEEAQKKEKERKLRVKEERRRKTELLKAKFIEEGLLAVEQNSDTESQTETTYHESILQK